jgi:hypothetical protein
VGSKFWLIIVDEASDYTWSIFLKTKCEQNRRIMEFIKLMKNRGTPISKICLDNSGENKNLKQLTKSKGLNITYEFTSPNTPQ